MKTVGIVLIALGILALVYQGFTYKRPEQVAKIGDLELTSEKQQYVWVPPTVGVIVLVSGVVLVAFSRRGV